MKTIINFVTALFLLVVSTAFASGSALVGTWDSVQQAPMGEEAFTLIISEKNGILKGEIPGDVGPTEVRDLVVDGNEFSFKHTLHTFMGELDVQYFGTLDGDRISGQVESPVGNIPFSGNRSTE